MRFATIISVPVEVTYEYHPASPGTREKGQLMDPDNPGYCEITSVTPVASFKKLFDGTGFQPHLLSANQLDDLTGEAFCDFVDKDRAAVAAAADDDKDNEEPA